MIIERVEWRVVGFVDWIGLFFKILEFCGMFLIYEIEEKKIFLEIFDILWWEIFGKKIWMRFIC